jgi:hypothetical protein
VFATGIKKDVKLDAKWEALAAKEIKGKDVKETLVRETNEQMLVKPLYTQDDWKPSAGPAEVPGKCHLQPSPPFTVFNFIIAPN